MFDYDFLLENKFVFYGEDVAYSIGEEFDTHNSDYRVFRVDDWTVIGPILPRLYHIHGIPMLAPPFWLTEKDIIAK